MRFDLFSLIPTHFTGSSCGDVVVRCHVRLCPRRLCPRRLCPRRLCARWLCARWLCARWLCARWLFVGLLANCCHGVVARGVGGGLLANFIVVTALSLVALVELPSASPSHEICSRPLASDAEPSFSSLWVLHLTLPDWLGALLACNYCR